ncbi:MAG: sigma-70 family RNA polymerase sigma factor, partial [SAR324 cluster bacterium]|nr:sigma-70 family RNA polymerase sigma factor [SAR324 cluster bacterium]
LKNFRQDSSILTWLYRIVYNLCIDEKRKLKRRGGVPDEYDEGIERNSMLSSMQNNDEPHEVLLRKERAKKLGRQLAKLSVDHRQVVMMREIDGLSYEEISSALRISKGTVMSRLHYARKKLQEALKEYAPAVSDGIREEKQKVVLP